MSAFTLAAKGAGPPHPSSLPSPQTKPRTWFSPTASGLVCSGDIFAHTVCPHWLSHPAWGLPEREFLHTHSRKETRRPKVTPFRPGRRTGRMKPATDLPLASGAPRLSWPPSGERCRPPPPADLREGARTHRNESGSPERVFTMRLDSGLDSQAVTCAVSW